MPCTMPRPSASCDFHRSCPMPGRTKRTAMRASAAEGSGSARDGSRGGMPRRLLRLLGVAALELLDAARGVDDLLLAGVVRVGLGGDLDLDDRVLLAVGPLHQLAALGVDGRAGEEGVVRAGVEEDHRLVFGVRALLHGPSCWLGAERGGIIQKINPFAWNRRTPRWTWWRAACRSGTRPPRARPSGTAACAAPRPSAAGAPRSAAPRGGCRSGSR